MMVFDMNTHASLAAAAKDALVASKTLSLVGLRRTTM